MCVRDDICERWYLIGTGHPVADKMVEAQAQLACGIRQRHERISGFGALWRVRAEADVPFAHTVVRSQFGRVVMQWYFRVIEHQQQHRLLRPRLGNPLIQRLLVRRDREQRVKGGHKPPAFGGGGRLPISHQISVEIPKLLQKVVQYLPMQSTHGVSFL